MSQVRFLPIMQGSNPCPTMIFNIKIERMIKMNNDLCSATSPYEVTKEDPTIKGEALENFKYITETRKNLTAIHRKLVCVQGIDSEPELDQKHNIKTISGIIGATKDIAIECDKMTNLILEIL